ncbi:DUF4365 domain-containing protein [Kitasatospora sp. NPDC051853]|uniref:DUF4365 domain-containing protein n=1 Tax=Kitasatospora sp. NPDC051853 TaxID=3364058 RepID=UPI00379E3E45
MTTVPESRRTQLAAENAFRTLMEDQLHIVQRIDGGNDFGEDFIVRFSERNRRTPDSIAVQIKGGTSFRRAEGYAVRVEKHGDDWRETNIPVVCVVHDPGTGKLHWANATEQLRSDPAVRTIRIPAGAVLDESTVGTVVRQLRQYLRNSRGLHAFLSGLSGADLRPGDYLSYFVNDCEEEMIFQQRPGEPYGVLLHRDLEWEPRPVDPGREARLRERVLAALPAGVDEAAALELLAALGGGPTDVIMHQAERDWLSACISASQWLRELPRKEN